MLAGQNDHSLSIHITKPYHKHDRHVSISFYCGIQPRWQHSPGLQKEAGAKGHPRRASQQPRKVIFNDNLDKIKNEQDA